MFNKTVASSSSMNFEKYLIKVVHENTSQGFQDAEIHLFGIFKVFYNFSVILHCCRAFVNLDRLKAFGFGLYLLI